MKLTIGNKEVEFTGRDVVYWLGLIGMGFGWFATNRINQAKTEIRIVVVEDANKKQDKELEKHDEKLDEIIESVATVAAILEHSE